MCEILRIDGWRTVGIGITRGVVARRDCAATIRILPRGVLVEAAVFIGCDWSLSGVSMDDAAIRALSPKTASEAGGGIADIVDCLEFTRVWRGMW